MRRRKFNPGSWELQRERFQIERAEPPPDGDAVAIEQIVPAVLKSAKLEPSWQEQSVVEKWGEIVGPQIAAQTRPVQLQNGVLTVSVSHPIWLSELERFHKETILRRIKEQCPASRVTRLRFQIAHDPR